jgi:IS5 family transposase
LIQSENNVRDIGKFEDVFVDLGYRKHDYEGNTIRKTWA